MIDGGATVDPRPLPPPPLWQLAVEGGGRGCRVLSSGAGKVDVDRGPRDDDGDDDDVVLVDGDHEAAETTTEDPHIEIENTRNSAAAAAAAVVVVVVVFIETPLSPFSSSRRCRRDDGRRAAACPLSILIIVPSRRRVAGGRRGQPAWFHVTFDISVQPKQNRLQYGGKHSMVLTYKDTLEFVTLKLERAN